MPQPDEKILHSHIQIGEAGWKHHDWRELVRLEFDGARDDLCQLIEAERIGAGIDDINDPTTFASFTARIELGNNAMQNAEDVADALLRLAGEIRHANRTDGAIADLNGNTVGRWRLA
jgi:hypothetical protein